MTLKRTTPVGIKIDYKLWATFKMFSSLLGLSATEAVEQAMREYIATHSSEAASQSKAMIEEVIGSGRAHRNAAINNIKTPPSRTTDDPIPLKNADEGT